MHRDNQINQQQQRRRRLNGQLSKQQMQQQQQHHSPLSPTPPKHSKSKQPWQKILYGNRGYSDDYTDPMFLKDLQTNINVETFKYWEAVLGATKLTHQLSLIVVFLLVFHNLLVKPAYIQAGTLLFIDGILSTIGYIFFIWTNGHERKRQLNSNSMRPSPSSSSAAAAAAAVNFNHLIGIIQDDIKTVACILVFGFILSPMLHTLTKSISTDTIYTITFFVFLLHIMCYDYGMPAALVSRAISLNAAIFGTICLASRLETSLDAFVLLIVSFTLFAVYPHVIRLLESKKCLYLRLTPVILFVLAAGTGLFLISPILFSINLMMIIFCSLIYPFIFCYAQKFKNNIHGPWDEAIVQTNLSK